jgi:hypothetical protein
MRQWQRRTWTLVVVGLLTGVLITSGQAWHGLGQSASWARVLVLCAMWVAAGGCVRQLLRRGFRAGQ